MRLCGFELHRGSSINFYHKAKCPTTFSYRALDIGRFYNYLFIRLNNVATINSASFNWKNDGSAIQFIIVKIRGDPLCG